MVMQVLPDVSDWSFNGTYEMRGQQANLWVYKQRCVLVPTKCAFPKILQAVILWLVERNFRRGSKVPGRPMGGLAPAAVSRVGMVVTRRCLR